MDKKIVSQLNHDGFFVGATVADASPLEPNVFLLPGGAIDVPPPEVPDGKVARWANGWIFEDPAMAGIPSADAPTQRRFTSLEFLDLFQEPEQLAIVEASMQSATIKLWYDRTLAASFIAITDPRVSAGLDALVDANLLTSARKAEIVAAMSA